MKKNVYLIYLLLSCAVSSFWPVFATTNVSSGKLQIEQFPKGCGNPYLDISEMLAFYDLTIETIAAQRGINAKGLSELFAVSEMKKGIDTLIVNPQEESPLDRLIVTQLCHYRSILNKDLQNKDGSDEKIVTSTDSSLQEHLLSISQKLYKDSRILTTEMIAARAKEIQKNGQIEAKWADVKKARDNGRAKVRDLFE